jgi:DNA-directed RNA polymerase I, II, and III subunit RPABC3
MTDATLFEDTFSINDVNSGKYDRVSRLRGLSDDNSVDLTLDINHELFPVERGERLSVVLANSIRLDGVKDDAKAGWRDVQRSGEQTLADMYDYVCYGKVYRVTGEESNGNRSVGPEKAAVKRRANRRTARSISRLEGCCWSCPVRIGN